MSRDKGVNYKDTPMHLLDSPPVCCKLKHKGPLTCKISLPVMGALA